MASIRSFKSFLVSPYCQPPYQIANRCHIGPWDIAWGRGTNPPGRSNMVWGLFYPLLWTSSHDRLINMGVYSPINIHSALSVDVFIFNDNRPYIQLYLLFICMHINICMDINEYLAFENTLLFFIHFIHTLILHVSIITQTYTK